jgi:hypothetical protein
MVNKTSKVDPIREMYFRPVETAERSANVLFYLIAILSFSVLFINKSEHLQLYNLVLTLFVMTVIANAVLGLTISFYLKQRAEKKRLQDFLSKAYGMSLIHEETHGYYNNEQTQYIEKIGAQVFENCYFSKAIASEMLKKIRRKTLFYLCAWLFLALNRRNNLDMVLVGAQIIFSEQILSHWLKFEWLKAQIEKIYDALYRQFQNRAEEKHFQITIQENFVMYECAKAKTNILLSSKIFDKLNDQLSADWIEIKKRIKIQ